MVQPTTNYDILRNPDREQEMAVQTGIVISAIKKYSKSPGEITKRKVANSIGEYQKAKKDSEGIIKTDAYEKVIKGQLAKTGLEDLL